MIEQQVEEMIAYVLTLPTVGMYWFLFVSTIIENLFPPWPGDTMIVLAGFLMAHDAVDPLELSLGCFWYSGHLPLLRVYYWCLP